MQIQEAYFIKRRSSYQINGIHYFFPRALKSINQTEGVK